jgi:hypothetical protein
MPRKQQHRYAGEQQVKEDYQRNAHVRLHRRRVETEQASDQIGRIEEPRLRVGRMRLAAEI